MPQQAHIPILLWLPAAVLLHILGGGGATEAARELEGRESILRFSRGVRGEISSSVGRARNATEIDVLDEPAPEPEQEDEPQREDDAPDDGEDEPDDARVPAESEPSTEKPDAQREDKKPAEKPLELSPVAKPPRPADSPPEVSPPKVSPPIALAPPIAPPPDASPLAPSPPELPPPEEKLRAAATDQRIAIQNDPTLRKDQEDNAAAPRIADDANTTDEETMARDRSYDQNAPKPTGGGEPHASKEREPGNADEDSAGHSVEAPGEGPPRPGSEGGPERPSEPVRRNARAPETRHGADAIADKKGISARQAGTGAKQPDAVASPGGDWDISPDGGDGKRAQSGRRGARGQRGRLAVAGLVVPGRLAAHHSIDAFGLQDALGQANIRHEQERAHAVRLQRRRGSLNALDFKKYRAAIENYDPVVKLGNQTNLNAARVPFATFINQMHNRIHPIFADGFLRSLPTQPGDKLADMSLVTHVELVLDGASGALVGAGIVRPSGVTAFEVAALRSLEEASPFGKPPPVIVSPDGRVYLHWEFYRDPQFACTSRFAHPYLLKAPAPKPAEEPTLPEQLRPPPDDERRLGRR